MGESVERPSKKRRTWFRDRHHETRSSDSLSFLKGGKGFLVTCDQRKERQAMAHASNILSPVGCKILHCCKQCGALTGSYCDLSSDS